MGVNIKGDFNNLTRYLKRAYGLTFEEELRELGHELIGQLALATPVDSGITASAWDFDIEKDGKGLYKLSVTNSSVAYGSGYEVDIVTLLHYGHGTGTGGYVSPNPYITEITDKLLAEFESRVEKEMRYNG